MSEPTTQPKRDWSVAALLTSLLFGSMAHATLDIVLGLEVYAISRRPLDLGLLGLAAFAPAALLVLVTGSIADRFDRRRVATFGMFGEAATTIAIFVYLGTRTASVGPILAFAFIFGIARAFTGVASRALPADIVAPERVPWVVARTSITWQTATILGPVLGGFLFATGTRVPYIAITVMSALGGVLMFAVRPSRPKPLADTTLPAAVPALEPERTPARATLTSAVEGLRFVRRQPILLGAISLDLFAVLLGGVTALLPIYARDILHAGPWALGLLRSAPAVGALASSVVLAHHAIAGRAGHIMFAAVGMFGAASFLFGLSSSIALSFLALVIYGACDAISVVIRQSLVQMRTPYDMLGRVMAVNSMFTGSSGSLGEFRAGAIAAWLGAVPSALIGGLGAIAVMLIWMWAFPQLRQVDKLHPDAVR
jgi:MFS family permease